MHLNSAVHVFRLDRLEQRVKPFVSAHCLCPNAWDLHSAEPKSRMTHTKYTLLRRVRLSAPKLFILYQIDLSIEAKGVTPIPAVHQLIVLRLRVACAPPTSSTVSNLAKSSLADPNGLKSACPHRWRLVTHPSTMTRGMT